MASYAIVSLLAHALALIAYTSLASAAIVEHSFRVQNLTVSRLCKERLITVVNGEFPGPTITVQEGDTVVVHVFNESPYIISLHWHGVSGLSGWADGPDMITQCPIRTGHSYTYKFNITKQEGTLFWHAHEGWLRDTVFGALIIRPRAGHTYPFPKPYREVPILLGEWWSRSIIDVRDTTLMSGGSLATNDAFLINGLPGDLYPCSQKQMFKLNVKQGKTYLLRVVNTGLHNMLFFKIANHSMTVVGIDGSYTTPYVTDFIFITLGQTTDVLFTANQPLGSYYMASSHYDIAGEPGENKITRGVIVYDGVETPKAPIMPDLPLSNDTFMAHKFQSTLTSLVGGPHFVPVSHQVNENMLIAVAMGIMPCPVNSVCNGPFGQKLASSLNNVSFELPTRLSMLEAFYYNVSGIYTTDFPDKPPIEFDYVNTSISLNHSLIYTKRSTSLKKLKFNSTVEIIFQGTSLLSRGANHPMHLHGFSFHLLGQGFGNYDPAKDHQKFNLFNPPFRSTAFIPLGGWMAIRFVADNPGVWLLHCHVEVHMSWGMATAFVVDNGPTPSTRLSPPPLDLPQCLLKRPFFSDERIEMKGLKDNLKTQVAVV